MFSIQLQKQVTVLAMILKPKNNYQLSLVAYSAEKSSSIYYYQITGKINQIKTTLVTTVAPKGGAARLLPVLPKAKLKKHRFCRHDDTKGFHIIYASA
jgi:hypothetical protein